MSTILYASITALPCNIVFFILFWNWDWRSRPAAVILTALNMLVKIAVCALLIPRGGQVRAIEFVFSVLGSVILLCFLRIPLAQYVFTYVLVLDYLMIARGVSSFLAVRAFSMGAQSWVSALLCLAFYALTLPLLLRVLRNILREAYGTDASMLWRIIWLTPVLASAVVLIYTNAFDQNMVDDWLFLIARVVLLLCVFAVCGVLARSLEGIRREAVLQERARQMESILELQRRQYGRMRERMEESQQAKQELYGRLEKIRSLLNAGDRRALLAYLNECGAAAPSASARRYCRNYALDTIVRFYAEKMAEAGIEPEIRLELPEQIAVADPDLCVLMGNLLENALEACRGQEKPFVRAAAACRGERAISLIVDNSAPTPPRLQGNGTLLSTKHDGAGIGTQSVRSVAERYGGTARFEWKDGVFSASVFLNPRPGARPGS